MIELRNFKLQDQSQIELLGKLPKALVVLEQSLELGLLLVFTKVGYRKATLKFFEQAKQFGSYLQLFESLEDMVCNFAAILVMPDKIILARDIMGSIPLFYSRTPNSFAISVSLENLRQHLNLNEIDKLYLEVFLAANYASSPQWEITPWKNIVRVRPNYAYSLNRKEVYAEKFAKIPEVKINSDVDTLGRLLETELLKASPESDSVGVLLSGGFDSSLLLSIAKLKSEQLYALHHVVRSGDRNTDTVFAEFAVEFVGENIQMDTMPISGCWDYKNWVQYATDYDEPNVAIAGGELETQRALHFQFLGVNSLICGVGGDAFREDLSFLGDFIRTKNYVALIAQLWRLSEFMQINQRDWQINQDYDQDCLQQATYLKLSNEAQSAVLIGWLHDQLPKTRRDVYKQLLYSHAAFSLEQSVLWKYGISQHYPFLTRKSLEIALAIPPALHIDNKLGARAFFKRCFAHRYHPKMLKRHGKDTWGAYHSIGFAQEFQGLKALFEQSHLAKYGLLSTKAFLVTLENRFERGEHLNFVEERVVALEIWLQSRK